MAADQTRAPAVAGSFYPADASALAAQVDALLDSAAADGRRPAALVVPHAGYSCSGPVAASAYALMEREESGTVAVFGPAHYVDPHGLGVPNATSWHTPLGDVPVDQELCERLVEAGLAHRTDAPHAPEHSLEVQVPFLQRLLAPGWRLFPVVVGRAPADIVADAMEAVAPDVLVLLASSDLSHYHDLATAERLDRRTAEAVVRRDAAALREADACGVHVLRGLVTWASRHGLSMELLHLATSAETCSGPDRVVGYGAFAAFP